MAPLFTQLAVLSNHLPLAVRITIKHPYDIHHLYAEGSLTANEVMQLEEENELAEYSFSSSRAMAPAAASSVCRRHALSASKN
jgi:hypothetical protein